MEVIDLDLQGHFGHFDSEFKEFRLVHVDLSENHQICTKYASWDSHCWYWKWEALTLTFKVIWSFRLKKTAFNVSLIHWSRLGKGGYTSQTCSCIHIWMLISVYFAFYMMTSSNENVVCVTNTLWGEPPASDAEFWCFLWFAPEQTVEETIETPVIWDAIVLIMTSL